MPLRMSTLFLRTLRDDPADAEVASHKLLVRAGYIRRAAPGGYTWLPLGLRVINKVENIVREEMNAIGGQEVHFPALLPKEPYEATGRWEDYGDGIFRLHDRSGAEFLLAPTHEEMFTLLVKDHYSSYKDLPVYLYQIQTKYRDEARPRAGLLRVREFIMKDSYSFTVDDEGLNEAYDKHRAAYIKIFQRLGLEVVAVDAMAGAMGGSRSEEFLHPSDAGEDTFVESPVATEPTSKRSRPLYLIPLTTLMPRRQKSKTLPCRQPLRHSLTLPTNLHQKTTARGKLQTH